MVVCLNDVERNDMRARSGQNGPSYNDRPRAATRVYTPAQNVNIRPPGHRSQIVRKIPWIVSI